MKTLSYLLLCCGMVTSAAGAAMAQFETDTIPTSAGELKITFIGHGSLIFQFNGKTIHIDPFGQLADYSQLPKADLVLITHDHFDHLDPDALAKIRTDKTAVVLTEACSKKVSGGIVMKNGDTQTIQGIPIQAVPAYNIVHLRDGKNPFHPKGVGNGYILTFGEKKIYVAGDTENTPEMKKLTGIDIAFLPMNLPYTMTPEMVADAARAFKPKILYPYHFSETDTAQVVRL
ncbi:MAG: MBL fold metallo-hydrolase, partial [Desulfobacteraceae bacterium]|nr:MBL fold metallo-hydrolase [Desulfobacteraceae bacterium]